MKLFSIKTASNKTFLKKFNCKTSKINEDYLLKKNLITNKRTMKSKNTSNTL